MKKQSLRAQALAAPKFVLVTEEFGFKLFIGDPEKTDFPATDLEIEAMDFSIGYDNPKHKVGYYKAASGYVGLKAVALDPQFQQEVDSYLN